MRLIQITEGGILGPDASQQRTEDAQKVIGGTIRRPGLIERPGYPTDHQTALLRKQGMDWVELP